MGRKKMRPFGSSLACILMVSAQLAAQEARLGFLHYTITGEKFGDKLGQAIAGLNDVDGDKCPDFAVGVPQYCAEDDCRGKVVIYSGKTGTVIRSWGTEDPHWHYGQNVANGGDIDGDGIDDVLASGPTFIEQRSSRTGQLLGVIRDTSWNAWGIAILAVGDVDSDSVGDFAVGDTNPTGSDKGQIQVFSGRTRKLIWRRESERERDGFGMTIARIGDVDQDGIQELAVGCPGPGTEQPLRGEVHILHGADGDQVHKLEGSFLGDFFGARLCSVSDINRDGLSEMAVGVPGYPTRGQSRGGRVEVYNPRTRELLWTQTGQDFDQWPAGGSFRGDGFGSEVVKAGDVDGDSAEDLLVLSPRPGIGGMDWARVSICDGKTGEILAAYEAEKNETQFGWTLSPLGDIDEDGRSEFLIGAPEYFEEENPRPDGTWLFDLGRVYVVSYDPGSPVFLRGDTDLDGDMDITDSIALLLYLYQAGAAGCEEALDIDRSHSINLTDAVIILLYLFQAGMAPQPPFPECSRFEAFSSRLSCERSSCR